MIKLRCTWLSLHAPHLTDTNNYLTNDLMIYRWLMTVTTKWWSLCLLIIILIDQDFMNTCSIWMVIVISQANRLFVDDDVIKWKQFPRHWPFVRGIHRPPVNSPHKGQWREALMFSLICAWIKGWVNNRKTGDLRRHRAHYDVTVMSPSSCGESKLLVVWPHYLMRSFKSPLNLGHG